MFVCNVWVGRWTSQSHNQHTPYSQQYWGVTSLYHQSGTPCQSESIIDMWPPEYYGANTCTLESMVSYPTLPALKTRQARAVSFYMVMPGQKCYTIWKIQRTAIHICVKLTLKYFKPFFQLFNKLTYISNEMYTKYHILYKLLPNYLPMKILLTWGLSIQLLSSFYCLLAWLKKL